ncbi:fungal-specific transcription factor domain-containing protein [Xylogone sp. PMI_703]|nr:fungal-specific transcription factor domain-containing protein [Xylogone sp. PMI_703]
MSTVPGSSVVEDPAPQSTDLADVVGPSPAFDSTSTGGSTGGASERIEKTISCVNCRKRKLKCDRIKPACATCVRAKQPCEYPERKRNVGSKRRNMRELEARLAQVETKLVAEVNKVKNLASSSAPQISQAPVESNDTSMDLESGDNDNSDTSNIQQEMPEPSFNIHAYGPTHPFHDSYSQELTSLGIEEALPPVEMCEELTQLYFEQCHPQVPLIHKGRYIAALKLPPSMRPPICLQYAILATAAVVSDKYANYHGVFYQRSRKYLEQTEMKGNGELYTSVRYVQTWHLIANYEAKQTYFTRAWMSSGRCTRLAQMLGLHNLDSEYPNYKTMLAPPRDWIETEERRRAFWGAFYGDRWASSGTGWPMLIDETGIQTNLPSTERAFEAGIEERTPTLQEALTPEGAAILSPYGGVVLSACLFGHNFQHLQKTGPNERPDDLAGGEFWKRHRRMDNVLSNTFMFLPEHLRLPQGIRDLNVVFLNMNIHTSAICLHQAAVLAAQRYNLDPKFIRQCQERNLMAAEEVTNIMRLVTHVNSSNMPSWIGFCLYVAAGVFIQDAMTARSRPQSKSNVDFLLSAMKAMGKTHSITHHFLVQLEFDLDASGIQIENHTRKAGAPPKPPGKRALSGVLPEGIVMLDSVNTCAWNSSIHAKQMAIEAKSRKENAADGGIQHPFISGAMHGVWPRETSSSSPADSSGSSTNNSNQASQSTHSDHNQYMDPYVASTIANIQASPLDLQDRLFATTFNLPIPSNTSPNSENLDTSVLDVTNDTGTPREYPYRESVNHNNHNRGTAGLYGLFYHASTSTYNVDTGWPTTAAMQGDISGSASAFSNISPHLRDEDITAILEGTGWPGNNIGKE